MVAPEDPSSRTERRRVEQPPVGVTVDVTDHRRAGPGGGGHLCERRQVVVDERGTPEQVLGRVAGHRELGEDRQVRAGTLRLVERGENPSGVARQVAHHRVHLARGHPDAVHRSSAYRRLHQGFPPVTAPAGRVHRAFTIAKRSRHRGLEEWIADAVTPPEVR